MAEKKPITPTQFRAEQKNPKPGVYLFYGEENYIKQKELFALREKLCADESLAAFNHLIFTRDNYDTEALESAILTPTMMADCKLVELYEIPFADYRKKEDTQGLENAIKAASESDDTLLIIYTTPETFDPGEGKVASPLYKLLTKYAVPVLFAHESDARLITWMMRHFAGEKIACDQGECSYLLTVSGHDMATLSGEVEKLCAYLHAKEQDKLTKAAIDLICPHNKEIGSFDFADAVLDADTDKAFYILGDLKQRNEPVPVILSSVIRIYTDLLSLKLCDAAGVSSDEAAKRLGMHPYVAKLRMNKARTCERSALEAVILLCSETDEALKTSAVDEYILIERLIVRASAARRSKRGTAWKKY